MGFHPKPLCHGTKCSSIHDRLSVSDGTRWKWGDRGEPVSRQRASARPLTTLD
jgi:hypothetical protein